MVKLWSNSALIKVKWWSACSAPRHTKSRTKCRHGQTVSKSHAGIKQRFTSGQTVSKRHAGIKPRFTSGQPVKKWTNSAQMVVKWTIKPCRSGIQGSNSGQLVVKPCRRVMQGSNSGQIVVEPWETAVKPGARPRPPQRAAPGAGTLLTAAPPPPPLAPCGPSGGP